MSQRNSNVNGNTIHTKIKSNKNSSKTSTKSKTKTKAKPPNPIQSKLFISKLKELGDELDADPTKRKVKISNIEKLMWISKLGLACYNNLTTLLVLEPLKLFEYYSTNAKYCVCGQCFKQFEKAILLCNGFYCTPQKLKFLTNDPSHELPIYIDIIINDKLILRLFVKYIRPSTLKRHSQPGSNTDIRASVGDELIITFDKFNGLYLILNKNPASKEKSQFNGIGMELKQNKQVPKELDMTVVIVDTVREPIEWKFYIDNETSKKQISKLEIVSHFENEKDLTQIIYSPSKSLEKNEIAKLNNNNNNNSIIHSSNNSNCNTHGNAQETPNCLLNLQLQLEKKNEEIKQLKYELQHAKAKLELYESQAKIPTNSHNYTSHQWQHLQQQSQTAINASGINNIDNNKISSYLNGNKFDTLLIPKSCGHVDVNTNFYNHKIPQPRMQYHLSHFIPNPAISQQPQSPDDSPEFRLDGNHEITQLRPSLPRLNGLNMNNVKQNGNVKPQIEHNQFSSMTNKFTVGDNRLNTDSQDTQEISVVSDNIFTQTYDNQSNINANNTNHTSNVDTNNNNNNIHRSTFNNGTTQPQYQQTSSIPNEWNFSGNHNNNKNAQIEGVSTLYNISDINNINSKDIMKNMNGFSSTFDVLNFTENGNDNLLSSLSTTTNTTVPTEWNTNIFDDILSNNNSKSTITNNNPFGLNNDNHQNTQEQANWWDVNNCNSKTDNQSSCNNTNQQNNKNNINNTNNMSFDFTLSGDGNINSIRNNSRTDTSPPPQKKRRLLVVPIETQVGDIFNDNHNNNDTITNANVCPTELNTNSNYPLSNVSICPTNTMTNQNVNDWDNSSTFLPQCQNDYCSKCAAYDNPYCEECQRFLN